ncbi:MAG: uroporphyrinogen-III synthase, partial [Rhodococcus sp. (in: high G+C Gram-positive bacteria)]
MEPLTGKTIALTAERRADEFATLLERRGAVTVHVPAIHVLPLLDDSDLREKTARIIEKPPELTVISTGIGFRGWLDAA